MERNRAYRRRQVTRWKERVADYYHGTHQGDPRRIGQMSSTRAPCSCWMCGNPRRYFDDITLQERRVQLAELDS